MPTTAQTSIAKERSKKEMENVDWIAEYYRLEVETVDHSFKKQVDYHNEEFAIKKLYDYLNAGCICKLTKVSHAE